MEIAYQILRKQGLTGRRNRIMEKLRRKSWNNTARLEEWDYGSNARYYVRIGTKAGKGYFGSGGGTQNFASVILSEISLNQLNTSEMGLVAFHYWNEIPDHFPFVKLEKMMLLPNQLHAIIRFEKPGFKRWKSNSFSPQSRNLGSVIRGFKSAVKKYATLHFIDFQWAERYDEMIISNEAELLKISNIFTNNNP